MEMETIFGNAKKKEKKRSFKALTSLMVFKKSLLNTIKISRIL